MTGAAIEPVSLDDRGSFAWIDGARSSCAIAVTGGCLIVDPVDVPGLDAALARLGPVLGVVTLLDRHQRDAAQIAARLGVPRLLPVALGGDGVRVEGVEERTVINRRIWHEALLWVPDRRLLVCAEVLGTVDAFLARPSDRLGMHPFVRPFPPRGAFDGLDPAVIAVGHGAPLRDGAGEALRGTLRSARLLLPRHWLRLPAAAFRASRSAPRAPR